MRAVVSIELQEGSPRDLQAVRSALNEHGLWDVRANAVGDLVTLPGASLFGDFDAHDTNELRNRLFGIVTRVLADHGLRSRVMVVVGADLSWAVGDEGFGLLKP